ncbi:MAG: hypothetical protein ACNA77_02430 [Opitutales bacterium]
MADSTKDSPQTVKLEELLRFKRAERPDQTFWEQFDKDLHQRMMQTLVKKDPWYVQLFRGLTGKLAQTTAIAAAAAVLALMVIRPALVLPQKQAQFNQAALASSAITTAHSDALEEQPKATTFTTVSPVLLAEADYRIDSLTSTATDGRAGVTKDFGLDHLDVASYDRTAYTADMALSLSGFTATGVASIVY